MLESHPDGQEQIVCFIAGWKYASPKVSATRYVRVPTALYARTPMAMTVVDDACAAHAAFIAVGFPTACAAVEQLTWQNCCLLSLCWKSPVKGEGKIGSPVKSITVPVALVAPSMLSVDILQKQVAAAWASIVDMNKRKAITVPLTEMRMVLPLILILP